MKKWNGLAAGLSMMLACLMVVSPSELFAAKHKKQKRGWSKFSQGLLGQQEESQANGGQNAGEARVRAKTEKAVPAVQESSTSPAMGEADRTKSAMELVDTLDDRKRVGLVAFGHIVIDGKRIYATYGDAKVVDPSAEEADLKVPADVVIDGIKDPRMREKMINVAKKRESKLAEECRKSAQKKEEEAAAKKLAEETRQSEEKAQKLLAEKQKTAFDTLVKAGILKDYDINRCGSAGDDPVKKFELAVEYVGKVNYYEGIEGIAKWVRSIELFKDDPEFQQRFVEKLFEQIYSGFDDKRKLTEIKKVLAYMSIDKVVEIFKSNITDRSVELKARACAYAITDQAVLKSLLADDDSWARPRVKNCDADRRRNVYVTLLQNVTDEKLADKIFCETRLTKNTDIICLFDILDNLVGKISEAKRKELTDRAVARSAEAAKTTVCVKQYYVGMSCLDYALINYANGDLSASGLSTFDDRVSRKMTKIGFTKENRIKKLDIVKDNAIAACGQFGSLYGKVPDGKDVSGKTDVVAAIRSKTAYDDNAPGGISHSSSGVWKWIDYVHNVQAEIENNSGRLVLCEAVAEGTFNDKDVRKEQQNAALGAWADLASDADDKDMGADPGLDPVGK